MHQTYIGVKEVEAKPLKKHGRDGYEVIYPDGYVSWSPKATFETAYFPISDSTRISETVVEAFIDDTETLTLGEKTTIIRARLINGFELFAHSACVDAANYNEVLGAAECLQKIEAQVWHLLGFTLRWARTGVPTD
ncbi:hypothetical protein D0962_04845 [Leptolyngbyaceae cyanobacterium CCMR0082]|uniref:Uncharacterized protein n=2 Tax=Adonisia turfae TaxID=2950184 RepID=A0A6M0S0X9_9CYAN|nr:Gp49 family protein [Adonisia turfae]MDV3349084.1 Gp49 family protein [Leptothoe sp. LEGE 181152]NEZ59413.1 hypothetical protein [Adonisia turfae CCMR0081]NEZ62108.1 hypothetical protein [Adonisia turfae CCMR0082]